MTRRATTIRRLAARPPTLALASVLLAGQAAVRADTIEVGPGESIQAAIDHPETVDGDVVRVAPGIYGENINPRGLAITIRSWDPGDPETVAATVIDGRGNGSVVTCWSGEGPGTVLAGFTITGGVADSGGGMLNDGASPTVRNCDFRGNAALFDGGAVLNIDSAPVITNCTFAGNTAFYGGAIANTLSDPSVTNCAFTGNVAVASGGGLDNFNGSHATIANSTFTANVAELGGAVANEESSPAIVNSILWDDAATEAGDEIYNGPVSTPLVAYSDIAGSGGSDAWDAGLGTDGGGNLDADPALADPSGSDGIPGTPDDDLRVQSGSPAIDAGSNEDVPRDAADLDADRDVDEPTPFDLDGSPRFSDDPTAEDHGRGSAPLVDMGPYERLAAQPCPADLDASGDVGGPDLVLLLRAWGPCDGCPEDLDGSGIVDFIDLLNLLHAWGPCDEDARRPVRMSPSDRRKMKKAIRKNVDRKRARRKIKRRIKTARSR